MSAPDSARDLAAFGLDSPDGEWLGELAMALEPLELGPLGDHEIIEEVARGGQGVVYRAVQSSTGRQLALKRLVDGRFAGEAARRRFERELEAAARLRHPGIVTVLGYEQVDGVPLLAMAWVDGVRLDRWRAELSGAGADLRRVLRCFLRLCEAVEHAHRGGVLHLDLKPSNVLVDADDQPVVLDFGLALVDRGDAVAPASATQTRAGGFLGTLAYASPEQLRGVRAGLDARSDVYSLGVLLYELLSGDLPFEFDSGVGPALASQASGAYRRLAGRGLDLPRLLIRELDAIVARALAPAPADRYPSLAALTDDVRRALDGRPVAAHPPSLFYELRKFARLHRAACAWAAVALLSIVSFGALTAWQNVELERERALEAAAREAAQDAERRAVDAARARGDIVDFLFNDLFEGKLSIDPGAGLTLADLVDGASERATERFADRPEVEIELRTTLAGMNRTIGRGRQAVDEATRARELAEAFADAATLAELDVDLGVSYVVAGYVDEAIAQLQPVLESGAPLAPSVHCSALNALGQALRSRIGPADAAPLHRQALEIAREHDLAMDEVQALTHLGVALAHSGELGEAKAIYEEGLALVRERCGRQCHRVSYLLGLLGDLEQYQGRLDRALELGSEALEIALETHGRVHPETVAGLGDVGEMLGQVGRFDEARPLLVDAVALSEEVRGPGSMYTDIHRLRLLRLDLVRGEAERVRPQLLELLESVRSRMPASWIYRTEDVVLAAHALLGDESARLELVDEVLNERGAGGPGKALWQSTLLHAQARHVAGERERSLELVEEGFELLRESEAADRALLERERRRAAAFYRGRGDEEATAAVESL